MGKCIITSGVINDCDAKRRVGGVDERAWIYNLKDADGKNTATLTEAVPNIIDLITFTQYGGLFKVDSLDNAHGGGDEFVIAEGGAKFFNHQVIIKYIEANGVDLTFTQDVLNAKVAVILQTQNQTFRLYGGFNGIKVSEGSQNSGQEDESDTARTMTLIGGDKDAPKFVDFGGFDATLTALEALEV